MGFDVLKSNFPSSGTDSTVCIQKEIRSCTQSYLLGAQQNFPHIVWHPLGGFDVYLNPMSRNSFYKTSIQLDPKNCIHSFDLIGIYDSLVGPMFSEQGLTIFIFSPKCK